MREQSIITSPRIFDISCNTLQNLQRKNIEIAWEKI